jgi:hypothetical protein
VGVRGCEHLRRESLFRSLGRRLRSIGCARADGAAGRSRSRSRTEWLSLSRDAAERASPERAVKGTRRGSCRQRCQAAREASRAWPHVPPTEKAREALSRTRTVDPLLTMAKRSVQASPPESTTGQEMPARCPHCGGLLETPKDTVGHADGRSEDAGDADSDPHLATKQPGGAGGAAPS